MEVINGISSGGYRIEHAILIHKRSAHVNGIPPCFATIHPVSAEDGRPEIEAGTLLGTLALRRLATALMPEQRLHFIDPTILAEGTGCLLWWRPPAKARVWFNTKDELGTRSAVTPHPGLVFAATHRIWSMWAVQGSERPTPDTPLFQAPYYNVDKNGSICAGNADVPKGFDPSVAPKYEAAFWNSRFTHVNVKLAGELTQWKGGPMKLWKHLLDDQPNRFPEKALVPRKITLADLVAALARKERGE